MIMQTPAMIEGVKRAKAQALRQLDTIHALQECTRDRTARASLEQTRQKLVGLIGYHDARLALWDRQQRLEGARTDQRVEDVDREDDPGGQQ